MRKKLGKAANVRDQSYERALVSDSKKYESIRNLGTGQERRKYKMQKSDN